MISDKIKHSLNKQINLELYAAYSYLAMSNYFQANHLEGFASWMRFQSHEEFTHAMKYFDFLNERDIQVELFSVEAPPVEWKSAVHVFEDALASEKKSTQSINNLVDLAIEEKDHATHIFLEWFVTEQVEEVASVNSILEKLKILGNDHTGLFMMDAQMGQRTNSE